jgi:hypothetical protein
MKITTKQFQILTDINLVWDFLTDPFYEKLGYGKGIHWTFWKRKENGQPAVSSGGQL